MSHKTSKQHQPSAHERRRGESSLSEFAEYVAQQQNLRFLGPAAATAADAPAKGTAGRGASTAHHEELDELFQNLDLSDLAPRICLREAFLGSDEASFEQLTGVVAGRIEEGFGEAVFELGFDNNGKSMELTRDEWDKAYSRLSEVAKGLQAECTTLLTKNVGGDMEAGDPKAPTRKGKKPCSGKILIRRSPAKIDDIIELRIAVVGNVDAGKSTMLGVLSKGDLDDGRGRARVSLFNHRHEQESGRTSSVSIEIVGFDTVGRLVTSDTPGRKLSWPELQSKSAKVLSFTDLCGHEKYLRTTVFGLLSSSPSYCLLMVAANNGLVGMSKEHLGICLALGVPVIIVVTKLDITPPNILEQTKEQIIKTLKSPGARKVPVFVSSREESVVVASQLVSQRITPVFLVSNVTGDGLDTLRTFLNVLPHHGRYRYDAPFEFHVNDTFSVPFTGTVVSGVVKSGLIHEGDTVVIGPDSLGQFTHTVVRSIERRRVRVPAAGAGQSASFALKKVKRRDVRPGMVMLQQTPKVHRDFIAEVLILSHPTTIRRRYEAMLHIGPVCQTCAVVDMDREFIRTGDRATVAFRFIQRPEFIAPGDRLIFREGHTKGLGIVKAVGYDPERPLVTQAGGTANGSASTTGMTDDGGKAKEKEGEREKKRRRNHGGS